MWAHFHGPRQFTHGKFALTWVGKLLVKLPRQTISLPIYESLSSRSYLTDRKVRVPEELVSLRCSVEGEADSQKSKKEANVKL